MLTARRIEAGLRLLFLLSIFGIVFVLPHNASFAETTAYKTAGTVTTYGNPPFTNLSNCSETDSYTCDREQFQSYSNLYFKNFGDFGIPDGATVTNVRIRVTGKANTPVLGLYAGVSIGNTYTSNCQSPSDNWTMWVLNSSNIVTYNAVTPLSNGTLANCLSLNNIKTNNFIWRINYSSLQNWYANIDNFEIAFDYIPPIPTPTITPTPTPSGPQPFLDLPWDYETKGQTFADAALAINSYFDHEYPLLSSGLEEPSEFANEITSFDGKSYQKQDRSYSSHDGYDYGIPANVNLGDPVLAAAAGTAEYIDSCTSCGNMIVIDHGNGFQTRYMHMQKDGLITSTPGIKIYVDSRQQIGKVGATGNVSPSGKAGAHIHFGVFYDKNHDGNFNDNVPDGVTDPFGWQSSEPDPWENYSFVYNGFQRTGTKSYYLWKNTLGGTSKKISQSGGNTSSNRYSITFPSNSVSQDTNIDLIPEPIVSPSNILSSVGPTLLALAKDQYGNPVTNFINPFTLLVDFSNLDLSRFDLSTLSIYSSPDGANWIKEQTIIDSINQKASARLSHFTNFALMAKRLDTTPPTTTADLSGVKGNGNWFKSDVSLSLKGEDNENGLGVDYTLFDAGNGDWDIYRMPITIIEEGYHKFKFYSVDKDGNIENMKTAEFDIDKTPPVITSSLTIEGKSYIPDTWTNKDVLVTFTCTDSLSGVSSITNPILITSDGENQSVVGKCKDNAGNIATIETSGINIDKIAPMISINADPSIIWSPNGKLVPVRINGGIRELNLANKTFKIVDEYGLFMPLINDFGDTIFLQSQRNDNDFDGRTYKINVEATDLAGNKSSAQTEVVVPHDQSKK